MITTRVGRRGQTTIPKQVRETLRISEGDRVAFITIGGDVVLQPIRASLRDHRGTVSVEGEQDFDAIRSDVLSWRAKKNASAKNEGKDAT